MDRAPDPRKSGAREKEGRGGGEETRDQSGRTISNMASEADFEIIAATAGRTIGRARAGLVDAILDHGLVDMDGDDLAQK